jgi:hypothetical protein
VRWPGLQRLLREWRGKTHVPRPFSVQARYVQDLSWLAVPAGFTPSAIMGAAFATQKGALVLIDLSSNTPATVEATLVHELVHCEQLAAGMQMNHGAYFAQRKAELKERYGVTI